MTNKYRNKYEDEFKKRNYYRINLLFPLAHKDDLRARAATLGKSINQYINDLIRADMDAASRAARNDGRTAAPPDAPPDED